MFASLNNTTIQKLTTTLAKCSALQSRDEMLLLFRDRRIVIWRDLISDTNNLSERVSTLIDRLLDKADESGQNALVLFLAVLSERERTTREKQALQELARLVAKDLDLPNPFPVEPPTKVDPSVLRNVVKPLPKEQIPEQSKPVYPPPKKRDPLSLPKVMETLRRGWQAIPFALRWVAGGGLLILLLLWLVVKIPLANFLGYTSISVVEVTRATTPISTPTPLGIGSTLISPKDGMVQVYVPAGVFLRGASPSDDLANGDEFPQREIYLDAFWIDQYEVSNAQYAQFLNERGSHSNCEGEDCIAIDSEDSSSHIYLEGGVYKVEDGYADHPMIEVSWYGAAAYCAWAGRRLPTEAEWEKAARGTAGQIYPWGDEFDGRLLNFCDAQCPFDWADKSVDDGYAFTSPVGSYPAGGSPYGALDMAGNVWEWVNDWYSGDYYETSPDQNPPGPASGNYRVLRGGSWYYYDNYVRASYRYYGSPTSRSRNIGFRCVQEGFSP